MFTINLNTGIRNRVSLKVYQKKPSTSLINESISRYSTEVRYPIAKAVAKKVSWIKEQWPQTQQTFYTNKLFFFNHPKRDGLSKNALRLPLYEQTFCIQESGLTFINA